MLTDDPTAHESRTVAEHFAYLQQLAADGTVLMAGRTQTADEHTLGIPIATSQGLLPLPGERPCTIARYIAAPPLEGRARLHKELAGHRTTRGRARKHHAFW